MDSLNSELSEAIDIQKFPSKFPYDLFDSDTDYTILTLRENQSKEEYRYYKSNKGFYIRLRANYNFRDDYDPETNNFLKGSVRGELEWRLLEEGFFDYRNQAKIANNKAKLYALQSDIIENKHVRQGLQNNIIYSTNLEELDIVSLQKAFYYDFFDLLTKLYNQRAVSRQDLLKASAKIAELESRSKALEIQNAEIARVSHLEGVDSRELPFFSLDFSKFKVHDFSQEQYLQSKIIEDEQRRFTNYRLAFYVGENFTFSNTSQYLFPSVGMRMTIPLRGNNKKKRIEIENEIVNAENRSSNEQYQIEKNQIYSNYYRLQEDISYQFEVYESLREDIRVAELMDRDLGKNTLQLIHLKMRQLECFERLVQLKRNQYLNLAKLQGLIKGDLPADAVIIFASQNMEPTEKICLSSKSKIDMTFQLDYLISLGYETIYIGDNDEKAYRFLKAQKMKVITCDCNLNTPIDEVLSKDIQKLKL